MEIVTALLGREWFPFGQTGIVIAGFGNKEIFPSLHEIIVSEVIDGSLKYKKSRTQIIRRVGTTARIVAFAQREMVHAFMEGIAPNYRHELRKYLSTMFSQYPQRLLKSIPTVPKATVNKILPKLQAIGQTMLSNFEKQMDDFRRLNHIDPVLRAVNFLSKDMLAEVAEALVNLTSFKRRISLENETVGGPIDVAVISRGDGFIWIKRKHYFRPELNQHFLTNYRRRR
jgi:hypothetical protein